jgi:hypothetical protein
MRSFGNPKRTRCDRATAAQMLIHGCTADKFANICADPDAFARLHGVGVEMVREEIGRRG